MDDVTGVDVTATVRIIKKRKGFKEGEGYGLDYE